MRALDLPAPVEALLQSARMCMSLHGFDFGDAVVKAEWTKMSKRQSYPARVCFPSIALARGFFYQHKDMEWGSDDGTQTMIVRLKHQLFDAELLNPITRTQAMQGSYITASMVSSTTQALSN